jgi:hypothetical protein
MLFHMQGKWSYVIVGIVGLALAVLAPRPAPAAKLKTILRAVLIPEEAQHYEDLARRRGRPEEERYWGGVIGPVWKSRGTKEGLGPTKRVVTRNCHAGNTIGKKSDTGGIIAQALDAVGRMSPGPMRNRADIDTHLSAELAPNRSGNPRCRQRPATSHRGGAIPFPPLLPTNLVPGRAGRIIRHSERDCVRDTYPTRVIRQDGYSGFCQRDHSLGGLCLFGSEIGEGSDNRSVKGASHSPEDAPRKDHEGRA